MFLAFLFCSEPTRTGLKDQISLEQAQHLAIVQKICHINGFPHQISVLWGDRLHPLPDKARATHRSQEQSGVEACPFNSVATATGERSVKRE